LGRSWGEAIFGSAARVARGETKTRPTTAQTAKQNGTIKPSAILPEELSRDDPELQIFQDRDAADLALAAARAGPDGGTNE